MPGNTVETRFRTRGTDAMERQLKSIGRQLGDLGNAGKNLKKSLYDASGTIAIAVGTFEAMKFAAYAATEAVRALSNAMLQLSERGGTISAVSARFEQLASPNLLAGLQQAAGQLVNNNDLMIASNQALANELLTEDVWGQWVARATRAAQDLDRDVTRSIQNVASAFAGGGLESIKDLGVNFLEVKERVQDLGLSMESARGRMEAMRIAAELLDESYQGIDNSAGNTSDAVQQITVAFENMRDVVAETFAENRELVTALEQVAERIRSAIPYAVQFGMAFADLAVTMLGLATQVMPRLIEIAQRFVHGLQSIVDTMVNSATGRFGMRHLWGIDPESFRSLSADLGNFERSLYDIRGAFENVADSAERAATARTALLDVRIPLDPNAPGFDEVPELLARPSGANRRRRGTAQADPRKVAETAIASKATEEAQAELELQQLLQEKEVERLNAVKELEMELSQKREEERAAELEHYERMKEMEVELAEKAADTAAAIRERQRANTETAAGWGQVVVGAMGTIGSAFGELASKKERDLAATKEAMRAMGKSEEEITAATKKREKAVERARKAEGAFLVAQNVVLAAMEIAKAIGAIPNPVLIASHAAAAAAHIVAASLAATKLGGGGGGSAGSLPSIPSVETFTPAEDRGIPTAEAEGPRQTNIVNYYSFGRSGEDLGRALRTVEFEYERSDGRAVGGMGVSYS